MNPFKYQELRKSNFIQQLLGKQPIANCFIELNNLLAQNEIYDIEIDKVEEIAAKYGIRIRKKHRQKLVDLYVQFLRHCLEDKLLSEEELGNLVRLRHLLGLGERDVREHENQVFEETYNGALDDVLKDGKLSDQERKFLDQIRSNLRLPTEVAQKLYTEKASSRLRSYLNQAVSDERISPEEDAEIEAICGSLGIELQVSERTQRMLEKYRLFWHIENGDLPNLSAPIKIQKSERLHFECDCDWYEHRRITKRINYGGPTARIKIAKGIYWRAGSLGVQKVSEDRLTHIDSGSLYLTNKRLIFMGDKGNKTIRLNRILDVTPYQNGVDIQKDAGRSPFLEFSNNVDIFAMILLRAIDEC